ncbi:MAG: hypothetical protein V2B14_01265 [bacterium]
MYALVNDFGELEVFAEEGDLCYICEHVGNCPLLTALQAEVVILRYESMTIENCGMFYDAAVEVPEALPNPSQYFLFRNDWKL